ncbi:MAG: SAM-dependent methyltransferase [Candidatus Melainabacteria bacterium]
MITSVRSQKHSGSFRDPDGFLFFQDNVLYRQVNASCQQDYDLLMTSGLYSDLTTAGQLIPHTEAPLSLAAEPALAYKILQPQRLPFIGYAYEWSFTQLKQAALLTLAIQKKAIERGMSLKDATAYNVQFLDGRPVFIDTLSFEAYEEGSPWVAYRQFCQHFLAPLALMALTDVRLSQLMRVYIDGIPLDLAGRLLPVKSKLNFGLLTHIHFHAGTQKKYEARADWQPSEKPAGQKLPKMALLGLIDSLEGTVEKLTWTPAGTEWGDYYENTNYTSEAFQQKRALVGRFIERFQPATLWDFGANLGEFSRVASEQGIFTVAFDIDPAAVEKNVRLIERNGDQNILPLVLDLTNPSPATGWANTERHSVGDRGPVDTLMALALIHHLAISNNLPLEHIADWFSQIARSLIIEFVPKSDSQVKRLLATREDVFPEYTPAGFEAAFSRYFTIEAQEPIPGSERTLYAMKSRVI